MSVYKKANGKWYCLFMIKGERVHKLLDGATDKETAKALEDVERYNLRQIQGGIKKREEKKYNITKVIDLYLNYSRLHKKDYIHDLSKSKSIKQFFKNKNIDEILTKDIENYIKHLRIDKGLSNATINRYLAALKKMFNIAIANDMLHRNPCVNIKQLKENNEKIRYLTIEEEKRLFEVLPEHIRPIVICALQTGMRRSNILNLRWEQIDFEYNFIEIEKQENKGHKIIRIPISKKLLTEFNKIGIKHNGFVFINPETQKPYNTIRKAWLSALKRANIQNFRFHDLRHTVATRLVEKNVDIRTVQEIMAHSSIATTQRYMHPTPKRKLEAVEVLNSYE